MDFSVKTIVSETLFIANQRKLDLLKSTFPVFIAIACMALYTAVFFHDFETVFKDDAEPNAMAGNILLFFILFVISGIMFMKAIINCHRVYLLDESPKKINTVKWRRCDTLFFKSSIKLVLLYFLFGFVSLIVIGPMMAASLDEPDRDMTGILVLNLGFQLLIGYLASRFTLVLPAAATDSRISLREAWHMSSPHHLKLFVLIGIIPVLTTMVISLLPQFDNVAYFLVIYLVWCMVAIIELGLLSLSFTHINKNAENGVS